MKDWVASQKVACSYYKLSMKSISPTLVTTALPYANGPIHIGHLLEYIQADCWVRALRMDNRDEKINNGDRLLL